MVGGGEDAPEEKPVGSGLEGQGTPCSTSARTFTGPRPAETGMSLEGRGWNSGAWDVKKVANEGGRKRMWDQTVALLLSHAVFIILKSQRKSTVLFTCRI